MNAPFEFTERMNEISGYGGAYERACRAMVCAGAQWCALHPQANPVFVGFADIVGWIEEANEDARALREAIFATPFTMDDGRKVRLGDEVTGAMFHAAIHHIMWIAVHGWNAYRERMEAPLQLFTEDGERASAAPAKGNGAT